MARKVLEEIRVRGELEVGKVPSLESMERVFTKKDALALLRSVLMRKIK